MNTAITRTNSIIYYVIPLLALLVWPLSAQSQTINYAKDAKVMANACMAFLSSGKSPASALESAGFQKNKVTKKVISYIKGDNPAKLVRQPIWVIFSVNSSKRGPACLATFTLKKTQYGWDMAGLAIGDAFEAAFAAQGYKKKVVKKEKSVLTEAKEETFFVKSSSAYQFESARIPLQRDDHFDFNRKNFRVIVTPIQ